MRIIVTADLHYDVARSTDPARRVAEDICGLHADTLLLLGDAGGRDAGILSECLHLFDRFEGHKLFVAGNHDIWTYPGEDSLARFEEALPALCREAGFHPLDVEPAVIDGVGFVGTMGWYDYSFRPRWLEMPLRFYEAKMTPGAAARLAGHEHLVADMSDIPSPLQELACRWMDGEHVRLPMDDAAFCRRLCERFEQQLDRVARRTDIIVAGLHHVPFAEIVPQSDHPRWAFASTYMGSEMFGQAMLAQPKVRYAFCGHSHRGMCTRREHVTCVNVGATYVEKLYDVLDL